LQSIAYDYIHGGDAYDEDGMPVDGLLDFSISINPLGMPQRALDAAIQALEGATIYPDFACRRLVSELAAFENIDRKNIFCSNGASDIIFRLAYALKPAKILVVAPSFADYERAGRAVGAKVIFHKLKQENGFQLQKEIISTVRAYSPDIVFICNPNNPTGILAGLDVVEELAAACDFVGSVLLVDECFMDFVQNAHRYSAKTLLGKYKNLIVLKSFTKIFAMPGLRLGYALCENEALLDRMRFCGPDWAVSNVAQVAGIAALTDGRDYIEKSVLYVQKERERITSAVKPMGFMLYPSSANFIFFQCQWGVDLRDILFKKGILVRDCRNFAMLEHGYFRSAVLTYEKNTCFLEALKEVEISWRNQ